LDTIPDTKLTKIKHAKLSPNGKWRSFSKVPSLVQHVNTDAYFGRVKIEGKIFRESLETDVFTTAKLLLGDWIKSKRKHSTRSIMGTFSEARVLYETDLDADHTLKDGSKLYRHNCITRVNSMFHRISRCHSLKPETGSNLSPTRPLGGV
jgi:hypothetical protein